MQKLSLTPILLSGGGRSGSTQVMSLLGSDPAVAFDRHFPYENRYLTYFAKFALLLQRPDLHQFLDPEQLFDFDYLGFGGSRPWPTYVPPYSPYVYLPRPDTGNWITKVWELFCKRTIQQKPESAFYAEKAPVWLAPLLRQFMQCFTIYNFRDPRDIFISTNAFIKKRNSLGFARSAEATDRDHARRLAHAFLYTFESYYADRNRDDTLLLRYEDYVLNRPEVIEKLRKLTGAKKISDTNEPYLSEHATARDVNQSVKRWEREAIPQEVVALLEQHLQEEMPALGYPLSLGQPKHPVRSISFAEGRAKLTAIDHSSHGYLEQKPDYAEAHIGGPDFHIFLPFDSFSATEVKEVWICVGGEIGRIFSLYWRGRDTRFSETCCINLAYEPSAHWTILSFPVGEHPEWSGTITNLRLDLFNSLVKPHKGIGRIRWVRLIDH